MICVIKLIAVYLQRNQKKIFMYSLSLSLSLSSKQQIMFVKYFEILVFLHLHFSDCLSSMRIRDALRSANYSRVYFALDPAPGGTRQKVQGPRANLRYYFALLNSAQMMVLEQCVSCEPREAKI